MDESVKDNLVVLNGQGAPPAASLQANQAALQCSKLPLGNVLLAACHAALLEELDTLSYEQLAQGAVALHDFQEPLSLLAGSSKLQSNPIFASINLCIQQLLLFLACEDSCAGSYVSSAANHRGVLGFSSGALAAAAIACSHSIPSYLFYAVQAFRLSFWIGYRSLLFRRSLLAELPTHDAPAALSWMLIVIGVTYSDVRLAIDRFNCKQHSHSETVFLAATINDTCVSISGRPDQLALFNTAELPANCVSRFAPVHALYHSSELAQRAKLGVLTDITQREIRFPTRKDLKRPFYSTSTGAAITSATAGSDPTLAELVIDMILLHPVNWDAVTKAVVADVSIKCTSINIVNIGPGHSLANALARALSNINAVVWDRPSLVLEGIADASIPPILATSDSTPHHEPIAIVGMAIDFPGAKKPSDLWRLLERGLNMLSEVPTSRFDVSQYNHTPDGSKRKMDTKFGNFIDAPDAFDHAFFSISPREARSMDPQQRVLLRVAYEAMENAGYVPHATPTFNPDTFGTYVGVATGDYVENLRDDVDVYYSTGTLRAFLSGRISYALGLSGPSIVMDTACSSSMVAIYQACRALANRDCNAALAGGANVVTSPDMYLGLDRAHFLSPTGQCRPFDESADGYCRAEGCGMFVLKRVSDAIAENDHIFGLIRSIEVNQSAHADSITRPHSPTQAQLFKKVLASAGIHPHRVNVIEAHGTGTQAGDPSELKSLRGVLAQGRAPENPLYISAIKANIGHAEAASGAAGLAKLLLMLHHGTIPAQISLKRLNPRIPDLSIDNTRITKENTPWLPSDKSSTRIALLNNFGAAGSNTALILEEAPVSTREGAVHEVTSLVLGISAASEDAAVRLRDQYVRYLQSADLPDLRSLRDFTYTATARRQLYPHRISVSAQSKAGLISSLEQARPSRPLSSAGKTVFVFSGQGGQYIGMGKELYSTLPTFRRIVDDCHAKLVSWGFPGVLAVISPQSVDGSGLTALSEIQAYQAAIFVLEYALASVLMEWGVRPDAVAGHSIGEYAAMVVAGVIQAEDALSLVAHRARLMTETCELHTTGMMAVRTSPESMTETLQGVAEFNGLSVACHNSNVDCVVAGPLDQLDLLKGHLDREVGCKSVKLATPYAYHTDAMVPLLDHLSHIAAGVELSPPSIPIISNVHGSAVQAGDPSAFDSRYFSRHCAEPVQFKQGVDDLQSRSDFGTIEVWLEVGPHPTTLPMLQSTTGSTAATKLIPTLRKKCPAWDTLASALSTLYVSTSVIHWRQVFHEIYPDARCLAFGLPSYPFADTRFWVHFKEEKEKAPPLPQNVPLFSLLGKCLQLPNAGGNSAAVFETPIASVAAFIAGHSVSGFALCPASIYHEFALAAATSVLNHAGETNLVSLLTLSEVCYTNPLIYDPDAGATIRITITLNRATSKVWGGFSIASYLTDHHQSQAHCTGSLIKRSAAEACSKMQLSSVLVNSHKRCLLAGDNDLETYHTRTIYELIFARVVAYSKQYQTIKSITVDHDETAAIALMTMPIDRDQRSFTVHPVFMDTLIHVAGFIINRTAGPDEIYICSQVDSVKVLPELIDINASYYVYCNCTLLPEGVAVSDAFAIQHKSPGRIVAHLKRMRFRRMKTKTLGRLLASASLRHTLRTPVLNTASLSRDEDPASSLNTASTSSTLFDSDETFSGHVKREVFRIVAEACDMDPTGMVPESTLSALGVDSLMGIEIIGNLHTSFKGLHIDPMAFAACQSISDVVHEVVRSRPQSAHGTPQPPSSPLRGLVDLKPAPSNKVKEVLSSILEIPIANLSGADRFDRLGFDSLSSIEALHALRATTDIALPDDLFMKCATIQDVEAMMQNIERAHLGALEVHPIELLAGKFSPGTSPVQFQHTEDSLTLPLFLIHDGSGLAHPYSRLSSIGRPLWGIHNPKFFSAEPWSGGLVEMAMVYAGMVKETLGSRRGCVLGGWSFGGVVAFEVARQLVKTGIQVLGVILIDSPPPTTHVPLPDALIEKACSGQMQKNAIRLVSRQMKLSTQALVAYDYSASPAAEVPFPRVAMLRSREPISIEGIDCDYIPFLMNRGDSSTSVAEWERLLDASVPIFDIPGNHFQVFEPNNIQAVTSQLCKALELFESS
ncbi:hypothetical protein BOTBODRAFT_148243 [Botryobasidium botryosum FD-172 SS1]|uniref:Polyketide synthase n=1 Tax=Botryobasidium botryosum (strain FD-172 SS1) TaxID=930990 RepID=A0A067MCI6_BOTB1|nr:hypothetical protein BOTBODRAFT_148243 [Botryobasidium botryosum FD-172 SS1]